ncbi:MAG: sn-glycerol-1-phosphate dehydrogenase [Bacteroidaceae bacterium]|nr:sn-glycerol-1-phosphate dehydrogenase [Bacteroidaceae bacterium]
MNKVKKALAAASDTRALIIGENTLTQVAELFREQFSEQTAVIIADTNTFEVAGKQIQNILSKAGVAQLSPFIFTDPALHAEFKYIEQLESFIKQNQAIPIAVGSGTINDLTKLVSYRCGKRYMCVATAASMDGYTAFGASITYEGAKQTFSCPAPQALLADIGIISKAPSKMTASGYADLLAKVTAGADWIVSDELNVEKIDECAWSIVQDGLKDALSNPEGCKKGDKKAISQLIEGLVLGGFAMQWAKSSRPASGAEHQFSHLWNMQHHVMDDNTTPSHGFQVSIGTLMSLALYEQLLKSDIKNIDIDACVKAWPSLSQTETEAIEMFKGTDFPMIGATEIKAKYIPHDKLREQLTLLTQNWDNLKVRLQKQLISVEEAVKRLHAIGAPTQPEQIGISRERLRDSIIEAQHIRRRFTILDLAVRTRLLDTWTSAIFGQNGLWPII